MTSKISPSQGSNSSEHGTFFSALQSASKEGDGGLIGADPNQGDEASSPLTTLLGQPLSSVPLDIPNTQINTRHALAAVLQGTRGVLDTTSETGPLTHDSEGLFDDPSAALPFAALPFNVTQSLNPTAVATSSEANNHSDSQFSGRLFGPSFGPQSGMVITQEIANELTSWRPSSSDMDTIVELVVDPKLTQTSGAHHVFDFGRYSVHSAQLLRDHNAPPVAGDKTTDLITQLSREAAASPSLLAETAGSLANKLNSVLHAGSTHAQPASGALTLNPLNSTSIDNSGATVYLESLGLTQKGDLMLGANWSLVSEDLIFADISEQALDSELHKPDAKSTASAIQFQSTATAELGRNLGLRQGHHIEVNFSNQQWAQAVAEKAAQLVSQKISTADIQLDPPELGPLQIRVQVHQDQASVNFVAANAQVREALDLSLAKLRDMLQDQGLDLVDSGVADQHHGENRDADEQSQSSADAASVDEISIRAHSDQVDSDPGEASIILSWGVDDFA